MSPIAGGGNDSAVLSPHSPAGAAYPMQGQLFGLRGLANRGLCLIFLSKMGVFRVRLFRKRAFFGQSGTVGIRQGLGAKSLIRLDRFDLCHQSPIMGVDQHNFFRDSLSISITIKKPRRRVTRAG
jgi:hypothetical protein